MRSGQQLPGSLRSQSHGFVHALSIYMDHFITKPGRMKTARWYAYAAQSLGNLSAPPNVSTQPPNRIQQCTIHVRTTDTKNLASGSNHFA